MNERKQTKHNWGKKGPDNPRWNGGASDYPDHYLMKINRMKKLQMTKCKCEICGERAEQIHHIDGTKKNHAIENLMAICHKCHGVLHTRIEENLGKTTPIHHYRKHRTNKISKFRNLFGRSVEEFALISGLSFSAVYKILNGRAVPLETIKQFTSRCNISAEQIREKLSSKFDEPKIALPS